MGYPCMVLISRLHKSHEKVTRIFERVYFGPHGLLAVNNIHPSYLILYVYPLLSINFTSPYFEPCTTIL